MIQFNNENVFYRACINPACNLKKLDVNSNKCLNCGVQYSQQSSANGYVGKFLIEDNKKLHVYTFFTQALKELLTEINVTYRK